MKILVYTQSIYVRKSFINGLIPNGISVYHSENIQEMVGKLSKLVPDVVVFDVINENYDDSYRLMTAMKKSPSEKIKKIAIVMLVGNIDKKNLTKMLQLGAVGFIKSGTDEDSIAKYIINAYQKVKGAPPERKYVRVTLDTSMESERIAIKFRSPVNMQLIMGVIKDISAGGLAVELVGTYDPEAIKQNMEVKNLQFILNTRDVVVNAVVVAYQRNFCAFRFTGLTQGDREIISQFMFERIGQN